MTGSVTVKGKKSSENNCGGISYLTQEDVFLGTLSVRETMAYSAKLRVSAKRSREEIEEVVEKTIAEMGLEQCADQKIGNWHFRGISGGERKRLSIGLEILTQPLVMLLDEPTTGLDSASAFFVVWALRNIALHGRIVVCSIHQPSGYLFDLFHDLCLLSAGESVYFGEANLAVKFFEEAGFPCRERTNPTDHFLRCVNTDFDNVADTLLRSKSLLSKPQSSGSLITTTASKENLTTQNIKAILIEKYKSSEYATRAMEKIRQINSDGEVIRLSNKSKAGWWKQLYTMTDRSFVNMTRDVGYYWLRILFYVSIGVSIGTMYYKIDRSFLAIINRAKCQAFVYGFMICLSCGGLPSFMEELKVYARELKNKHYEESIVVIANFLSSFPFLVVMSFTSGTVIYEMVKFRPGFSHYAYFCLNLFGCISVVESTIMLVAYLVPNVLMGIGLGTGLIVFMMLASEIARPLNDLPKFFWRYPMSYISFASWAMQGVYKNDMIGVEFEPLTPGAPKVKGETALQFMFGVPIERSKWWDLTVLLALVLFHRIIFFLVIKFKSRLSICITLRANKGFHSIAQTYSSLKKHFSSSKKRQPIHSLSSQLSLSSPIRP